MQRFKIDSRKPPIFDVAVNREVCLLDPIRQHILLGVLPLPTLAQEQNTVDPEVRQQIEAVLTKYEDAFNKNDTAAIAALYTADAAEVFQKDEAGGSASGGKPSSRGMPPTSHRVPPKLSYGLREGWLGCGLVFGLIFGLVSGLIGGFTDSVLVEKASPNQGIELSRKNSSAAFLVIGLPAELVVGLIFRLNAEVTYGLDFGLSVALISGLIAGFSQGGSTLIKHYVLRLILWLKGYTPLHFVKFLDYCAKLILLKRQALSCSLRRYLSGIFFNLQA
jgi:hypothetical protein